MDLIVIGRAWCRVVEISVGVLGMIGHGVLVATQLPGIMRASYAHMILVVASLMAVIDLAVLYVSLTMVLVHLAGHR